MTIDPLVQPQPTIFPAAKLTSLLRAIADPTGKGEISAEHAASIKQIEMNLAHYREATRSPEPTPGLEPGTPSLRDSQTAIRLDRVVSF